MRNVKSNLCTVWTDPGGLQMVEAPRICRQLVVSSKHQLPLPPKQYPCYSLLLWAELTLEPVWPHGFSQRKISTTPMGIKPVTWLVVQCLNQLCHHTTTYTIMRKVIGWKCKLEGGDFRSWQWTVYSSVPWLRQLADGISQQRPELYFRPVLLGYVVGNSPVTGSSLHPSVSFVSIFPLVLYTHRHQSGKW